MISSPLTEQELLNNAQHLAGKTLQQIAQEHDLQIPDNQHHNKGWVGQLLELSLGATAGSRPEPDFQHIGIELKTIPLTQHHAAKKSTFVCSINLRNPESCWQSSLAKHKLSRVLWVPIEADPKTLLATRRIGTAIIWSPNTQQEHILSKDWHELMDMIATGKLEQITAHHGEYLQIRPKASNKKALCKGINHEGDNILTLPRGFYLRPALTQQIITNGS